MPPGPCRAPWSPSRARASPGQTDLPELLQLLVQAAPHAAALQLGQLLPQLLDLGVAGCVLPLHLGPQALHLLGVGSAQPRELLRQPLLLLRLGQSTRGTWPGAHHWQLVGLVPPVGRNPGCPVSPPPICSLQYHLKRSRGLGQQLSATDHPAQSHT